MTSRWLNAALLAACFLVSGAIAAAAEERPDIPFAPIEDPTIKDPDNPVKQFRVDMARVDAVVVKDTTEVWTVTNVDGLPHSLHVHDVQFQVLSVGGHAPPPAMRPGMPPRICCSREDNPDSGVIRSPRAKSRLPACCPSGIGPAVRRP